MPSCSDRSAQPGSGPDDVQKGPLDGTVRNALQDHVARIPAACLPQKRRSKAFGTILSPLVIDRERSRSSRVLPTISRNCDSRAHPLHDLIVGLHNVTNHAPDNAPTLPLRTLTLQAPPGYSRYSSPRGAQQRNDPPRRRKYTTTYLQRCDMSRNGLDRYKHQTPRGHVSSETRLPVSISCLQVLSWSGVRHLMRGDLRGCGSDFVMHSPLEDVV